MDVTEGYVSPPTSSHLDHSVKHQHGAIRGRFEHEDLLEIGARFVEHLLHLELHGLAWPHDLVLGEPSLLDPLSSRHPSERRERSLGSCCAQFPLVDTHATR